jgi:molybdate transport system substrate-binding protein
MRPCRALPIVFCVALLLTLTTQAGFAADLVIFAAASLREALDEVNTAFMRQYGDTVTILFGASSKLAWQIESGTPANIFISADLGWMDSLERRHLVQTESRKNLLGNQLVIAAPDDADIKFDIKPGFDLRGALKGGHLAMADPSSVPAGKYGKASLETLGVWDSVESVVARTEDVRGALSLVSRHKAPLGIVYTTDVAADSGVKVVGVFPPESHPPILYPIALTTESGDPAANRLLEFLGSPAAKAIFEKHGFSALP